MTRDEILNMPAGRKIDALIAEYVMGWKRVIRWSGSDEISCLVHPTDGSYYPDEFQMWSKDVNSAFEVVENLREKLGTCKFYTVVDPKQGNNIRAIFDPILDDVNFEASADTVPLAICRAALLAVMK